MHFEQLVCNKEDIVQKWGADLKSYDFTCVYELSDHARNLYHLHTIECLQYTSCDQAQRIYDPLWIRLNNSWNFQYI